MFMIAPLPNGKFRLLDDGLVYGDYDTEAAARDDQARLERDELVADDIRARMLKVAAEVAKTWDMPLSEARRKIAHEAVGLAVG